MHIAHICAFAFYFLEGKNTRTKMRVLLIFEFYALPRRLEISQS